jgi:hypothetical protein
LYSSGKHFSPLFAFFDPDIVKIDSLLVYKVVRPGTEEGQFDPVERIGWIGRLASQINYSQRAPAFENWQGGNIPSLYALKPKYPMRPTSAENSIHDMTVEKENIR